MTFSFSYICMQIQFWKANKKLYRHRITVDGSQDWISTSMSCLLCSPDCLPVYNNSTLKCDCSILLEYKVNVDTRTLSIAYRFWHHVQISDYSEWAFKENSVSHFISTSKKLKPMWSTDTVQWKPLFFPVFFWFFSIKLREAVLFYVLRPISFFWSQTKHFQSYFFQRSWTPPLPQLDSYIWIKSWFGVEKTSRWRGITSRQAHRLTGSAVCRGPNKLIWQEAPATG